MSELVEIGLMAYRNERYRDAIDTLLQATDQEPHNWMAKLYLGMSYHKVSRVADAHRLFKRLTSECTEEDIREKAQNALTVVEAEMNQRFNKVPINVVEPKKVTKQVSSKWQAYGT